MCVVKLGQIKYSYSLLEIHKCMLFALMNGRHLSKQENCKKHQNITLDPLPPVVVMPFFFEDSVVFFAFSSNSACTTDKLSLITAPHRSDQNIRRVDAWTSTHPVLLRCWRWWHTSCPQRFVSQGNLCQTAVPASLSTLAVVLCTNATYLQ